MPSRVIYTKQPGWRTWVLKDYARYWYAIGVVALLVLGVGELARLGTGLTPLEMMALVALVTFILFASVTGYALLWRRDGPWAVAVLARLRRLAAFLGIPSVRADSSPPPTMPKEGGEQREDERSRREDVESLP